MVQDGAVLLAKYIEHQRGVFLQDHHHHPPPPSTAANGDEDSCNSTPVQGPHQKKQHKPLRVLELGCGTGFAGIAAALSLGSDPGTASAGGQGIARVISGTGACSDSISEDSSTAKPDPCTDGGVTPPISPTFLHGRDSAANQRTTQIGPPARKDRASVFRERSCENSSKGGRIGLAVGDGRLLESAPDSSPDFTHTECGVYVVLTDLGYALGNARSNIEQNRSSIAHRGARVVAAQLDWTKPVPPELVGELKWSWIYGVWPITMRCSFCPCLWHTTRATFHLYR